jgi:hypothetical protein
MKTIIVMMIYYAVAKDAGTQAAVQGFESMDACYKARETVSQDYLRAISYFGYSSGMVTPPYVSCLSLPSALAPKQ